MDLSELETWLAPFLGLWRELDAGLPRLAAAAAILIGGLFASFGLKLAAQALLALLRADHRLANSGLLKLWREGHPGQQPSKSLARLPFYGGVLATMLLAIHVLDGGAPTGALASLLGVAPRMLSVMLILLLGSLLGAFVAFAVRLVLAASGMPHPVFWGKVSAWCCFGAGALFALEPLGLAGQILGQAVLIILGAMGLAAALAFGLGCRDLAREFVLQLVSEGKDE